MQVWKPERIPEPVCAVVRVPVRLCLRCVGVDDRYCVHSQVFEEACGGTMLFFLMAGPLPERIAKAVFRQLLEGEEAFPREAIPCFCHAYCLLSRSN